MTDQELAVLQASDRELAAIGRNINQIAKALNEAFHETERVGVLGTMERKFRLSFRHIPSKVSAQVIPSRWQDRAEAAALLSSPPPA
jgi:hypothetical protein